MMRPLALALTFVLLLALCACGQSGGEGAAAAGNATFRAGFARRDITPMDEGISMRGFGDEAYRLSTDVISLIYVDCLALQDKEGNTALILSLDMGGTNAHTQIREAVSKATGVPVSNVVESCTHQHSSPADAYNASYRAFLVEQAAAVAVAAMEDLAPATIEMTTVQTERMNFVRHYIMNDGTYAGDNFGSTASGYKEHVSQADPSMQLVKFVREGEGKRDILLTNFQGHPHLGAMAYYTSIHSDTVGVYRDAVSAALDCEAIYFSGAGGNVKMKSAIEGENLTEDFKEHGRLLSKYAINAEGTYTPIEAGTIRSVETSYTATVDHSEDHLLDVATAVNAKYKGGSSASSAMALAGDNGISSVHHAGAIVTKFNMGATAEIEHMVAIAVGDLAFVAAPYEMFDQDGVYIKEESPFKMTIVCTIANGGYGYMPTLETFEYNGYEADTSKYIPGTAEALAEQFVQMLEQLHQ